MWLKLNLVEKSRKGKEKHGNLYFDIDANLEQWSLKDMRFLYYDVRAVCVCMCVCGREGVSVSMCVHKQYKCISESLSLSYFIELNKISDLFFKRNNFIKNSFWFSPFTSLHASPDCRAETKLIEMNELGSKLESNASIL